VKVFISWSGEPSRSIARALDGWLESVVQHVDVWMSDEEIGSGQQWNEAIRKSLNETNVGIVCVTRANQHVPWLIFEAGALAKSVAEGRVVPLCIDLKAAEVTGPLSGFQGRSLDKDGVKRLVRDLNEAAEKKMPKERLDGVFKAMWPELEAAVLQAINAAPPDTEPRRSAEDMLEELVERIRHMDRQLDKEAAAEPPIVFTKAYVKQGLLSKTTYMKGTRGIPTRVHTGPGGEITHIDVRLADGRLVPEVPIDYFIPESGSAPAPVEQEQP
jgi:hypothetical protein